MQGSNSPNSIIDAINFFNENNNVDIIIFSYDRPLQLYAFLESIDQYCVGVGKCFVLYRASDKDYEKRNSNY